MRGAPDKVWVLELGVGLGPVRFGMSLQEAAAACRCAPDTEPDPDEDGVQLYVDALGLRLDFPAEDGDRLSSLETDMLLPCTLEGELLTRHTMRSAVRQLTERLAGRDGVVVGVGIDETSVTLSDLAATFYFDLQKLLSGVSMSLLHDEHDEPIWPDSSAPPV